MIWGKKTIKRNITGEEIGIEFDIKKDPAIIPLLPMPNSKHQHLYENPYDLKN